METKAKTRTEVILIIMHVVAWVAFVGLMIEAGAMIISYGVSCVNPVAAKNLYRGLDLSKVREFSFLYYSLAVSLMVAFYCMKAFVAYLVIKCLSKVNMSDPFKTDVARLLERISYVLLGSCLIALISNGYTAWLSKRTGSTQGDLDVAELIFMAALVFIISQVFKRGVEIQSENDLTI